ncbi:MAG TPA: class I SAM-dependent methyltransferase [Pseudomonadales bacterium]
MEPIEYQRMAELEADFWWYRALHRCSSDWLTGLQLPAGAAVLDAGCGTGGLLQKLLTEHPLLDFHALEFNPDAATIAGEKTGLPIQVGRIEAMPYSNNRFDAIISNDVLYHANVDEPAAIAELHRCLKPGGHLLVNVPAYEWLRSSHDRHVHSKRRYTASRLRTALTKAGFDLRYCSYRNGLLLPLMALHRLTAGSNKDTSDVEPVAPWLNRLLYTVTRIEQALNNHKLHLPFGGSAKAWAIKP